MAYESKPNTGVLFPNQKRRADTDPTNTGDLRVECPKCGNTTDYRLSGWMNQAKKSGMKYMRLVFRQKADVPAQTFADIVNKDDVDDFLG